MSETHALPAVLLVAHGSRDASWSGPFFALRDRMRELDPLRTIELGFCELCPPSLEQAIADLHALAHREIIVVAAFLALGSHLREDLPRRLAVVQGQHPGLRVELRDGALGSEPEVIEALARVALRRVLLG